jgi:hypothetical protein
VISCVEAGGSEQSEPGNAYRATHQAPSHLEEAPPPPLALVEQPPPGLVATDEYLVAAANREGP